MTTKYCFYIILGYLVMNKLDTAEAQLFPFVRRIIITRTVPLIPLPYFQPCCTTSSVPSSRDDLPVPRPNNKNIPVPEPINKSVPFPEPIHNNNNAPINNNNAPINNNNAPINNNNNAPINQDSLRTRPGEIMQANGKSAAECANIVCREEDTVHGPVCACNHKTGNTVSFANECDLIKHNCRFGTAFKTILNEICPWEFEARSGRDGNRFNYYDARYH